LSPGFAVAVTRLPSSGSSAPVSYRGVSTEVLGRDFHPLALVGAAVAEALEPALDVGEERQREGFDRTRAANKNWR
jgi:hypothetical protein